MGEAIKNQMVLEVGGDVKPPVEKRVESPYSSELPRIYHKTTRDPEIPVGKKRELKSVRLYEQDPKTHPNQGTCYEAKGRITIMFTGDEERAYEQKYLLGKPTESIPDKKTGARKDKEFIELRKDSWFWIETSDFGKEQRTTESQKRTTKKNNPKQIKFRGMPKPIPAKDKPSEAEDIPF